MALFNKLIKDGSEKKDFLSRAKEMLIGKEMPEKPIIKMCMMGPRGVGKTSVLTSVYNSMNEAVTGTQMYIKANTGTSIILNQKKADLKNMFKPGNKLDDKVRPGIAGDDVAAKFGFDFGINTQNVNMGLEITDFPGEYVLNEPETVKAYIADSSAIMLAIDTPHLMEHDGKYNEAKNRTSVITSFFMENAAVLKDRKLVLLVPLKCEKYYHEGCIEEVTQKVKAVYADLIRFLQDKENTNGMKGLHACVIAPILTLGEVVFDCFGMEDGVVAEVMSNGYPLPKFPQYKYQKAGARYAPKYCEQPVYYLLSFVSKLYRDMKEDVESSGLLRKMKRMFQQIPENDIILREMHKFKVRKVDNVDGFVVLFGKGKV